MKQKIVKLVLLIGVLSLLGCSKKETKQEVVDFEVTEGRTDPSVETKKEEKEANIEERDLTTEESDLTTTTIGTKDLGYYKTYCKEKLNLDNNKFVYRIAYEDDTKDIYLCFIRDKVVALYNDVTKDFVAFTPNNLYIQVENGLKAFPIEDIGVIANFMDVLYTKEFFDSIKYEVTDIEEIIPSETNSKYVTIVTKTKQGNREDLFDVYWCLNKETDEMEFCRSYFEEDEKTGYEEFYIPNSDYLEYNLDFSEEQLQEMTTEHYEGEEAQKEVTNYIDLIKEMINF